ncbi:hypothetical protein SAMN04487910_0649 [Aquimarina amphilecti]|uniref:Lipoprotein n=1 Tax=Aquimarina amphilecti TaxID=1038014 RepID=A0A1H7HHV3_AQUAM|nr:hypothetical protein [Aquimarina amphilecti]SEK49237.1 hypothetical protein SAMN04487910_0649 [Aquimarina amphilecti]
MKQTILISIIGVIALIGCIRIQSQIGLNKITPLNYSFVKSEIFNHQMVKSIKTTLVDFQVISTELLFRKEVRSIYHIWLLIGFSILLISILIRVSIFPKIESLTP